MKKTISVISTILLMTLVIAVLPTDAEARIYNDTLRLHILANSDNSYDQDLKLKLRDKILFKYGNSLKECDNILQAEEKANYLLSAIEEDCELWIAESGYNYDVECKLSEEWYETRNYEGYSLPCGYYASLQIIIGGGKGKNWWCVMYPPLCTYLATEEAPSDDGLINYTKEELFLIKGQGYNIKFKGLELISQFFSKK